MQEGMAETVIKDYRLSTESGRKERRNQQLGKDR